MKWVKRFIVFLVVGFALFYLIAYPEAAADPSVPWLPALPWSFARSSSSFRLWLISSGRVVTTPPRDSPRRHPFAARTRRRLRRAFGRSARGRSYG